MIAALTAWKDRLLGRGDAAITVPVFDGALKSNRLIEDARIVATLEAPEDVASDGQSVFVADGARVLQLKSNGLEEVLRCTSTISALACMPGGGFAVAIEGKAVRIEGGLHHGKHWSGVGGERFNAVNAITVGQGGRLLVTDGSTERGWAEWKRDLMSLGRSGRVFELTPADGGGRLLAANLLHAFGACDVGGGANGSGPNEIWTSESWRHHVVRLGGLGSPAAVTDALPGYPSRLVPAAGGGAWLTCFTLRTQLVEFVLREPTYRKRMLAEIDPAYWIAPALNSGNTFLEPMQGAQLKMMGVVKPWAPPRSYGLVVRLDAQGLVRYSLHSRFDGKNHGVVAAAECAGQLYLIAKGSRRLLALDIAKAEQELHG
jgi:hypothetical protein